MYMQVYKDYLVEKQEASKSKKNRQKNRQFVVFLCTIPKNHKIQTFEVPISFTSYWLTKSVQIIWSCMYITGNSSIGNISKTLPFHCTIQSDSDIILMDFIKHTKTHQHDNPDTLKFNKIFYGVYNMRKSILLGIQ